jgi:type I restriction enzyme S subunit
MFEQGDIPFIEVYNLTDRGELDFSINPTFINKDVHYGELARSKVFPGDVLMNIVGPPLGKVAIVPSDYEEWNMNQAIAVYRAIPGIDNRFLCYCLLSVKILSIAVNAAKATAGQFNLTLENLS